MNYRIYQLYDLDTRKVLYIGITSLDLLARFDLHVSVGHMLRRFPCEGTKARAGYIVRYRAGEVRMGIKYITSAQGVEHALAIENAFISVFKPPFNVMGNPDCLLEMKAASEKRHATRIAKRIAA